MIAHWLVEIHRVQDRRVEPRQELFRDDQDFRPLTELCEALPDLLFARRLQVPLLQVRRIVVAPRVYDLGVLRGEDLIERLLVERARFAIDAHQKSLVTERLDVLPVVVGDVAFATFFTRSLPLRKFLRLTARSRILFSSSMSAIPSLSASARNSFSMISCGTRISFGARL